MRVHIWTYNVGNWEYIMELNTVDNRTYVQETNRKVDEFEQRTESCATNEEAMHWILNRLSQHYGE